MLPQLLPQMARYAGGSHICTRRENFSGDCNMFCDGGNSGTLSIYIGKNKRRPRYIFDFGERAR